MNLTRNFGWKMSQLEFKLYSPEWVFSIQIQVINSFHYLFLRYYEIYTLIKLLNIFFQNFFFKRMDPPPKIEIHNNHVDTLVSFLFIIN